MTEFTVIVINFTIYHDSRTDSITDIDIEHIIIFAGIPTPNLA